MKVDELKILSSINNLTTNHKKIDLQNMYWSNLNNVTGLFFIMLGFLNLYVAYNFAEDTWVNFKLFGITGILFIYIVFLTLYISKVSQK